MGDPKGVGGGGGGRGPDHLLTEKLQVAIGPLRKTGMDTHREVIGPIGTNCFSRAVHTTLCEICWWQTKKVVNDKESIQSSSLPHLNNDITWESDKTELNIKEVPP